MFERSAEDLCGDNNSFAAYQEAEKGRTATHEEIVDQFADCLAEQARGYRTGFNESSHGLAKIVSSIARSKDTLVAISGMVLACIEEQIRVVKIQTIGAILSLVKAPNPHLTIDVIEHVFGLAKDKEADIARKHGESRQVISKRVVKMRRHFGIETEQKKAVCAVYSENRKSQYCRAWENLQLIKNNARSTVSATS